MEADEPHLHTALQSDSNRPEDSKLEFGWVPLKTGCHSCNKKTAYSMWQSTSYLYLLLIHADKCFQATQEQVGMKSMQNP
uniref:Uncharacterized protein n=1 Tax=Amphilophus citrinellus TaxID=61819 RepID=A0A3Q0QQA0_AMPCI